MEKLLEKATPFNLSGVVAAIVMVITLLLLSSAEPEEVENKFGVSINQIVKTYDWHINQKEILIDKSVSVFEGVQKNVPTDIPDYAYYFARTKAAIEKIKELKTTFFEPYGSQEETFSVMANIAAKDPLEATQEDIDWLYILLKGCKVLTCNEVGLYDFAKGYDAPFGKGKNDVNLMRLGEKTENTIYFHDIPPAPQINKDIIKSIGKFQMEAPSLTPPDGVNIDGLATHAELSQQLRDTKAAIENGPFNTIMKNLGMTLGVGFLIFFMLFIPLKRKESEKKYQSVRQAEHDLGQAEKKLNSAKSELNEYLQMLKGVTPDEEQQREQEVALELEIEKLKEQISNSSAMKTLETRKATAEAKIKRTSISDLEKALSDKLVKAQTELAAMQKQFKPLYGTNKLESKLTEIMKLSDVQFSSKFNIKGIISSLNSNADRLKLREVREIAQCMELLFDNRNNRHGFNEGFDLEGFCLDIQLKCGALFDIIIKNKEQAADIQAKQSLITELRKSVTSEQLKRVEQQATLVREHSEAEQELNQVSIDMENAYLPARDKQTELENLRSGFVVMENLYEKHKDQYAQTRLELEKGVSKAKVVVFDAQATLDALTKEPEKVSKVDKESAKETMTV